MRIDVTVTDYDSDVIEEKTFELRSQLFSEEREKQTGEMILDQVEIGTMADYVHDQIVSGFLVSMVSEKG